MATDIRIFRGAGLAVLFALIPLGAARAQDMTDIVPMPIACPSTVVLPAELTGWNQRSPLPAAGDARGLAAAQLEPGSAVDAGLRPMREVHYPLRPEKPGGSASFGGIYAFPVTQAGTYRIVLGAAAWVDVVKSGPGNTVMASTAHRRGPDCSGIRKMVDFALEPGVYLLQISGNPEAKLPLLVTRVP